MKLVEIYELILQSIGVTVDDTGAVFLSTNHVYIFTEDGKRPLYLPTKEVLSKGDWGEIAAFHPMCEYVYSGQSEVLNTLIELVGLAMSDCVLRSAACIVSLAGRTEEHTKLRIKQTELISKYDVTKALVTGMMAVATKHTGISGKYPILSVRLDRSGIIDEEIYARTCTILPHVLTNTTDADGNPEFMGTTVSKKTGLTIKDIFTRCFPDKLKYGDNSVNTPYLFALLKGWYNFAVHINELTDILGKYSTVKIIDTSWYEYLPEMKKLQKSELPQVLPYNRGVSFTKENDTSADDEDDDDRVEKSDIEKALDSNPAVRTGALGLNKIGRSREVPPARVSERERERDREDRYEREPRRSERDAPLTIAEKIAMAARDSGYDRDDDRGPRRRYGVDNDDRSYRRERDTRVREVDIRPRRHNR